MEDNESVETRKLEAEARGAEARAEQAEIALAAAKKTPNTAVRLLVAIAVLAIVTIAAVSHMNANNQKVKDRVANQLQCQAAYGTNNC